MTRAVRWGVAALVLAATAGPVAAQPVTALQIVPSAGDARVVGVEHQRGYAAVPLSSLTALGWTRRPNTGPAVHLTRPGGPDLVVTPGSPFVEWDGGLVQLVGDAYAVADRVMVPLQLVTDVLPDRLPDDFETEGPARLKTAARSARPASPAAPPPAPVETRVERTGPPVVVIDPGHGGDDPGAMGAGGLREKDLALALGRALAEELRRRGGYEVHLTRSDDRLVPLWKRGEDATRLKGDRPGVFLSIHANALANRGVRGVETYFLSEARTEHERRVAALENASMARETGPSPGRADPDLDFILSELRNHDVQHWSADLAQAVQGRLAPVHPGPDRGVKQGPFAVITNALMPAVLIEAGFITHPDEERAMRGEAFQTAFAGAVADAVEAFFERYPPGQGGPARAGHR